MPEEKKVCPTCGGSGEIGYFAGESRFFITQEECPNCCGIGYIVDEEAPASSGPSQAEEHTDD